MNDYKTIFTKTYFFITSRMGPKVREKQGDEGSRQAKGCYIDPYLLKHVDSGPHLALLLLDLEPTTPTGDGAKHGWPYDWLTDCLT